MRTTPLEKIRNIGLVAHIDAGKTTTTERMLHLAGESDIPGEVHEGTTVTDWMVEEQRRGISITAAVVTLKWKGYGISIIDTPGHVDFTGEVERSLRVLDGAVAIFCAVGGVEAQTEMVWRAADRNRVPRIAFINKMDRVGADFYRVVGELRERLGCEPIVLHHPLGSGAGFEGVADLVDFNPKSLEYRFREEATAARERLLEALAERDDGILSTYLEGLPIGAPMIRAALRRLTVSGLVVPVLAGAALFSSGIEALLDAVGDYLPSPTEAGQSGSLEVSDKAPLSALIFKVMNHPQTGRLCYTRLFSGQMRVGDRVVLTRGNTEFEVKTLYRIMADEAEPVGWAGAGDIVALGSLESALTGDTLHEIGWEALILPMSFSPPVVAVSLEPADEDGDEELEKAVRLLASEDPTLKVRRDEETGQLILAGLGELHLEVAVARLAGEFKVLPKVGKVRVEYRETVRAEGRGEATVGREGLEATVKVFVEPCEGDVLWSIDAPLEDLIHEEAVKAALLESFDRGFANGFPVTALRARVVEVLCSRCEAAPMLLKAATARALAKAAEEAGTVLLSPAVDIEIQVPADEIGAVLTELKGRRVLIAGLDERGTQRLVKARGTLDRLAGFATELRSRTRGRAGLSMQPAGFEPVDAPNL